MRSFPTRDPDAQIADAQNVDAKKQDAKKRIGLVTNQTGLDGNGQRTIDVLAQAPGVSLEAIFSPEHGVTGTLDTTHVDNSTDAATGIPVYSVYGGTDAARRPSLDVMKTLDAVVFDIQDAGARFYTYETTLGYFLEAAAEGGVELIVLDRPNPVTGSFVQGPVSDAGPENFTNYWTVPLRHGMTMGELAKMFNAEREHQREADRGADGGVAARGLVRFDGADVGESVAEFAERVLRRRCIRAWR